MKVKHILSKSRLDLIHKAPVLYKHKYIDGTLQKDEDSPALIMGKAVHCRILEPQEFGKRYTIAPNIDRRTKEGKELWHQFAIKTEGLTILTKDQDKQIEAIAKAIYDHPAAAYLLAKPGQSEIMVNWQDRTLVDCRGIIDRLTDDGLIIDIKTTDDASPRGFARSCHKYRYHVQAAFYTDGVPNSQGFFFIAVEKSEPHLVGVYYMTAEDLQRGREEYQADIQTFIECVKLDEWPGYGDTVQPLTLFNYGK